MTKATLKLMHVRASALVIVMWTLGIASVYAGPANAFVFHNISELAVWELNSRFTNDTTTLCWQEGVKSLPLNFMESISNEITRPDFDSFIQEDSGRHVVGQKTEFEVAVCGGEQMGFSIRADCSLDKKNRPPWITRLDFYLRSRFEGHTTEYVRAALKEQSSGTNVVLPIGFPKTLKEEFWIPVGWIEEDPFELDRIDLMVPKDQIPINQVWLVKDGKLAWIYYFGITGLSSQKRDPQEYDPANKMKFEAATKEALKIIHDQHIPCGTGAPQDGEVQQILDQEYGIHWLTPMDLN